MRLAHRLRSLVRSATRVARFGAPLVLLAVLAPAAPAVRPPALSAAAPDAAVAAVALAAAGNEVAAVRRDVRLRKLHLVRPDLIQYPLCYDVYC